MQPIPNTPSENSPQDIYDLTGKVFGPITVLRLDHIIRKRRFWLIRCICGTESVRPAHEFRTKPPPCDGCEINHLRETGQITPDWLMALGFDATFWSRFWPHVDKNGPVPAHMPHLGNCHLWTKGVTSKKRGCIQQRLREDGKPQLIQVHRAAFIMGSHAAIPERLNVLHRCDVPRCVRWDHLFLDTIAANNADCIAKGRDRHALGMDHGNSKFTDDQVREIRRLYKMKAATQRALAEMFHCSQGAIGWIVRDEMWRHLL